MSNLESKLKNIQPHPLSEEEKNYLWYQIVDKQSKQQKSFSLLEVLTINKRMIQGIVAILLVLAGSVTMASANSSAPGDPLFGLDVAMEKTSLALASSNKKADLEVKYAKERLAEVEVIVKDNASEDGFVFKSDKQKDDLVFSMNSINSSWEGLGLSSEEVSQLQTLVEQIESTLGENSKWEIDFITSSGQVLEVEKENGYLELEYEDDDYRLGDDDSVVKSRDIKESEDEVFCRGEWRDEEDCSKSDDDYEDNSDDWSDDDKKEDKDDLDDREKYDDDSESRSGKGRKSED